MVALPTGTLTFFFSDVEGSTRLLEDLGDEYTVLFERYRRIVRDAFDRSGAVEVGTEGDSFFAVFSSAANAVDAAVAIQRAVAAEEWPRGSSLRVRIGLHTGEGRLADNDYVGLDVHRAARIMAAAHGGQIVVSEVTRALVERALVERAPGDGAELRDLGEHRLRDLSARERLFQVVADGLPSDFPPPRGVDAVPNNLPTQASRLVDRVSEREAIRQYLDSGVRLVTLTGPGGIGKTRLSLHVAAEHVDRFPDGAFFVDLADARDPAAALQAIVQAAGVTVAAEVELRDALARQFGRRRLLLLLDNFEQVIAAADDVSELITRCPQLNVLVTSREALRVRGEQLLPVSPLPIPGARGQRASADDVSRFDAVSLFVERAREVRPDFRLTDENAATVAEICARLDGLPLAIELAAARLRLFSPEELLQRLQSRLEVLRGGARDLPARQRTLRSTIEWSYELLDEDERRLFQLLSLFPTVRVADVEALSARLGPLADVDVLERLASLVDKSLVRSVEGAGGQRLSMLDTIREYAAERLAQEPLLGETARRAHADYFAELAQAKHADVVRRAREAAVDELANELGNLQAAWRYFVDAGDLGQLGRLLDALWLVHEARGWYQGALSLANDLLPVLSTAPHAPERVEEEITVRMTLARGLLALRGYTEEIGALYQEALALAEAGAIPRRFPILRSLASFHLYRGELDKTAAIGREMLELAEREADESLELEAHLILGPAIAFFGDMHRGLEHLDRVIALFDPVRHGRTRFRLGPNPGVAAWAISALFHVLAGNLDTADRRAAGALEIAEQLGHPYSLAYATFHVGLLDLWRGRVDAAHERALAVREIAEEHHYQVWQAVGLVLSGVSMAHLGRADAGLEQTERGVALYEDLRTPPVFWPQILGLRAQAAALAGRNVEALELADRAQALEEGSFDAIKLRIQKADLLVSMGRADEAEPLLRYAVEEGGSLGTNMLQLQAATRLARIVEPSGRADAIARLQEVYGRFTEGFDSVDLVEARAVLEEVGSHPA